MEIITNWKFWINADEDLLIIEDYSDAQASSALRYGNIFYQNA